MKDFLQAVQSFGESGIEVSVEEIVGVLSIGSEDGVLQQRVQELFVCDDV